jgi:cyclic beta-1,2-glucan synthetase
MRNFTEPPSATLDSCARLLRTACAGLPSSRRGGRSQPPAAEWIADHAQTLHDQIVETREALSGRNYRKLPRARPDQAPHVQQLVNDFVSRELADAWREVALAGWEPASLEEQVKRHFGEAQGERTLTLAELCAIRPLINLALLGELRNVLASERLESGGCARAVRGIITSLQSIGELPWRELTESLSILDSILRRDPARVYQKMDLNTREMYRGVVERIATCSSTSEPAVATLAIELASAGARPGEIDEIRNHVGWYLEGPGLSLLERRAGFRPSVSSRVGQAVSRWPSVFHVGGVLLATLLIVGALDLLLGPIPWWYLTLLIVPASQAALAMVDRIVHARVAPRRLPRLDFSDGIPDHCRTFVVVPTLLLSKAGVDDLVEKLEVHYLANRDRNLRFALLTDGPDAAARTVPDDHLAEVCREGIEQLNRRYARDGAGPFYLFHRGRTWNEVESAWMGHERKRGKLNDFNVLLLGGPDAFEIKAGDLPGLAKIRYVITLDTDTQLPLDTARALVGTAAHPLNRPIIDAATRTVRHGYGILQPRVGISIESAERSRFSRLQRDAAGFDPYTTAVSDVYQDLYGHASFTGKGLYDLAAFHHTLDGRFPENTLLSHDLIEGEHARVGLVTDLELIDDYPGSYDAYSRRKHRWIRGDWQTLFWLLPRVPDRCGVRVPNPFPAVSRWKILDNLRRSVLEISLIAALVGGWFQGRTIAWTFALIVLSNAGAYLDPGFSLLRTPRRYLRSYARAKAVQFGRSHLLAIVSLIFLLHQAILSADAIIRTLVRRFVTGRHLLEWESMAQAESTSASRVSLTRAYLLLTPVAALTILGFTHASLHGAAGPAWLVSLLWVASPPFAGWLDRRSSRSVEWTRTERSFLRGIGLRTWRYFQDWSRPATHWIVPDNVQEEPERAADRTSPTNLGLQLLSTLAAHDFGYLTHRELAEALTRLLHSLEQLERHRGHFYNWYDTRTLEPLGSRYVSAVDSGNLAASLLTLKQGCLQIETQSIVNPHLWAGLRDHCLMVRRTTPFGVHKARVIRETAAILKRLGAAPLDLVSCARVLTECRSLAGRLGDYLDESCGSPGTAGETERVEARYWATALIGRLDTALGDVRRCAPWLDATDRVPTLAGVLQRVPTFGGCEVHYDQIEGAIRACQGSSGTLLPRTLRLTELLEQVERARTDARELARTLRGVGETASRIAEEMDFALLFDRQRKLLRVGYNVESQELDSASYGLLASEARTAVFLAIAKRDIPREAWFHLGRKLTGFRNQRTLLSWTGTMFEHVMPSLFMKSYADTLLGWSIQSTVRIQQLYAQERRVPWGVSEAASSRRDDASNHRYQAFGVPAVAMKRMGGADLVVAPHASVLALMIDPAAAIDNLRLMASKGWLGPYGFYESIDYRSRRQARRRRATLVQLFMAHHQGMSLLALDNSLFGEAMQRRFHSLPLVLATERLLHERRPTLFPAIDAETSGRSGGKTLRLPARPHRDAGLPVAPSLAPIGEYSRHADSALSPP